MDDSFRGNKSARRKIRTKKRGRMTSATSKNLTFSAIDFPINCSDNRGPEGRKSDLLSPNAMSSLASLSLKENDDVPDSWMERDNEESEEEEQELSSSSCIVTRTCSDTQKKKPVKNVNFPSEIWILLSDYIQPENVGRYARICRTTYNIVSSQGFWRRLYRRHYDNLQHCDLPQRLQPECMSRPRGLRAAVIKMLHLTHPRFLETQSRLSSVWPDPHSLTGNICVLQSCNRVGRKATYHYFKLKDKEFSAKITNDVIENDLEDDEDSLGEGRRTAALLSHLSDIHHNPEEGCSVLQVHAAHWSSLSPVMGHKLVSVSLSVSHGMRHHKLKLMFGSPEMSSVRTANTTEIVIDSVVGVKIYNWWHPHYNFEKPEQKSQFQSDQFFDLNNQ